MNDLRFPSKTRETISANREDLGRFMFFEISPESPHRHFAQSKNTPWEFSDESLLRHEKVTEGFANSAVDIGDDRNAEVL